MTATEYTAQVERLSESLETERAFRNMRIFKLEVALRSAQRAIQAFLEHPNDSLTSLETAVKTLEHGLSGA